LSHVSISIAPLGDRSDIRTIDAIKVIYSTGLVDLLASKRLVEEVLEHPAAILPVEFDAGSASDPAFVAFARTTSYHLAETGVELRFNGRPLHEFLTGQVARVDVPAQGR